MALGAVNPYFQDLSTFDIDIPMLDVEEQQLDINMENFYQCIEPLRRDLSNCQRSSFLFSRLDEKYEYLNLQRTDEGNYSCTSKRISMVTCWS